MEIKYYVIHENLEDDEGDRIWSKESYSRTEASEKADALGEKYPNAYVDIVSENNIHNISGPKPKNVRESFLDSQLTWTRSSLYSMIHSSADSGESLWDRYSIYVMNTDDPFKTFSDWLNS